MVVVVIVVVATLCTEITTKKLNLRVRSSVTACSAGSDTSAVLQIPFSSDDACRHHVRYAHTLSTVMLRTCVRNEYKYKFG